MKPGCLNLLGVLLLAPVGGHAQMILQDAQDMERMGLANTITYVQLLGDPDYDGRIREALSNGWSITKSVVFVEAGQSLGDRSDPTRSFLSFWDYNYDGGPDKFLALWQGHPDWKNATTGVLGGVENMPLYKTMVIAASIDLHGREETASYLAWRVPLVIRSMEQMVNYVRETKESIGLIGIRAEEFAKGLAGPLSKKTLLVWEGRFSATEIENLHKYYPFPMQVVPMSEILKALADRDERYAVLVFAVGLHHDVYVHDASTYNLLYARHSKMGYTLDAADVKAFAKAVDKDK